MIIEKIKILISQYKNIDEYSQYNDTIIEHHIRTEKAKFNTLEEFVEHFSNKEKIDLSINDKKKLIILLKYI